MNATVEGIGGYFKAFSSALNALDRIFEAEGPWAKRHNLINHVLNDSLYGLRGSFECWELYCRFAKAFKIDASESGFPLFRHVLELEDDVGRARERLRGLPKQDELRAQMLDIMLQRGRVPVKQRKELAERLYFEMVMAEKLFLKSGSARTIRHHFNRKSGRPVYVVHWTLYDGSANLPMIYMAVIEDSSKEGMTAFNNARPKKRASWHRPVEGLPNRTLSSRFAKFVEANCAYGLTLTTVATALDKEFEELHPKQIRRFIVGPFYAGGVTTHNEKLQEVLDGVQYPESNWLLTWTMQELWSKEEKPGRWGLFGRSAPEEVFHINTDNVACAQQGVSALEHHALIPHEAYQAAYAQGHAADMLAGYNCYIVSGDDVLKNV